MRKCRSFQKCDKEKNENMRKERKERQREGENVVALRNTTKIKQKKISLVEM